MERDSKRRFSKKGDDGFKIAFNIPPIKRIIVWLFIVAILLPCLSIIAKFKVLNKILNLFDELMNSSIIENGNTKKGKIPNFKKM